MDRRRESRAARRKRVMRNRLIAAGILVILIILVIVLLISCNKKNPGSEPESSPSQSTEAESKAETASEPETEASVPDIPNAKPVNLYTMDYSTMTCNKVTSISKPWSVSEDLEAFGAFCSSEDSFEFTTETEAHNSTWNSVNTATSYKIGYELSFDVNGEHKVITILKPGDIETNPDLYNGDYPEDGNYDGITGYMGVWVYDDLNQDGSFYIHITQAEVTDETLLTSIKLRPTPQSNEISNLILRAYSYSSEEEFDKEGHYIGKYASQVTINNQ